MQFLRNILATVVAVSAAAFGVSADEAAAPGGTAEAAAKEAPQPAVKFTQAETDSIARAYATVMASYLAPQLAKDYQDNPDAAKEFVMGMRHAFDIRHEDSPYFAGVRHAMANFDRFDAMVGMGFPFTPQGYLYALEAALAGDTMGMDAKSADAYLHHIMERMYPAPKAPSAESQQAFLDAQAAREGVRKLPSGLLFEVITEGEGAAPGPEDVARVIYTGALSDGTIFDTTEKPIDLPVNGVVKGFSEGLQMMKPGGKYRLFIPAELGYGERGAGGGVIPPGSALDFTVTLVDVVKK